MQAGQGLGSREWKSASPPGRSAPRPAGRPPTPGHKRCRSIAPSSPSARIGCRGSFADRTPRVHRPSARRTFQHIYDAADHPAVIDPRNTSRIGEKMRRKPRKLIVGKPEIQPVITNSLQGVRNTPQLTWESPLWAGP